MRPILLLVEDSIHHLEHLCKLIFNLSIKPEKIEKLEQDGFTTLSMKLKSIPEVPCDLIICNNRQSAEELIHKNHAKILFCMLDLILPEDNSSKDATSQIQGVQLLELLQEVDVFTFIISADQEALKGLFADSEVIQNREGTQFIYKNFLTEDIYLAECYARLIKAFIHSNSQGTKWKLIATVGNFKGIDHIVELYQKLLSLNDGSLTIKASKNLRISTPHILPLKVSTEYSTLKNILIHFPGLEVDRVNPSNKDDLLFDQPVDYSKFRDQYSTFFKILSQITAQNGGRVFQLRELLLDLMNDSELGQYYRCLFLLGLLSRKYLSVDKYWEFIVLAPETIIEMAISGKNTECNKVCLDPIPNLLFTRDNIITIHDKLFLPPMSKAARKRENALLEFILLNHPNFIPYYTKDFSLDKHDSFEGGDFILFDDSTLFIGISDRTSMGALIKIMEYVFKNMESIHTVVGINAALQHERSMHLDTYMGVIGDFVLLFKDPLLSKKTNTFYIFRKRTTGYDSEIILGDFKDLMDKLNKEIEIIEVCEEREAYDDACNVLTISPNVLLTYDRGQKTIALLGARGFLKVNYAEEDGTTIWEIREYRNGEWEYKNAYPNIKSFLKKDKRLIFEVPGSELILARGGCHCMSMPLTRTE